MTGGKSGSSQQSNKGDDGQKGAKPVKLRIASAGVEAGPMIELPALPKHDEQSLSNDATKPVWYSDSARPGDKGIAVIAARFATDKQPGLMKGLTRIRVADPINVDRADGSTVSFRVTRIQQFAESATLPKGKCAGDKAKTGPDGAASTAAATRTLACDLRSEPTKKAELRVITTGVPFASKEEKQHKDEEGKDEKNPNKPSTVGNLVYYAELVP
ncbi:class F sortase [Streptomyces erythrochromogenes]|uniref:class F sortase n=1 Tax=Streptomyces erythrochromogenes TaxID=285574 RepID=UPI00380674E7